MSETAITAVSTDRQEDVLSSSRLLGSIPANSSVKRVHSLISHTYKQASDLFLTRRFHEALDTISQLIVSAEAVGPLQDGDLHGSALIASAKRSLRVKVWVLYLTLLNAIIELGPTEGKTQFGSEGWRALAAKAQDGTIWEEIVNIGYNGVEGNVDAEVVSTLATLLLAHSPTQTITQNYLENYLSVAPSSYLDLSDRFEISSQHSGQTVIHSNHTSGTDTLRDLNTRIRILELYTLHVLPRNDEWQYARDFIALSEILDDERREAFFQTLQALEDQNIPPDDDLAKVLREQEARRKQERLETERREGDEAAKSETEQVVQIPARKDHRRSDSEKDYGIDEPSSNKQARAQAEPSKLRPLRPPEPSSRLSPSSHARGPTKKLTSKGVHARGEAIVLALRRLVINMTQSLSKNPLLLLRTIFFLVALLAALGRRDVRDRVGRITGLSWDKIKGTVGMGVKVSYLQSCVSSVYFKLLLYDEQHFMSFHPNPRMQGKVSLYRMGDRMLAALGGLGSE